MLAGDLFRSVSLHTLSAIGLGGVPFHAVFSRQLAKISLDDSCVARVGQRVGVGDGTEVLLAEGLEFGIDTARGCLACVQRGRKDGRRGQEKSKVEKKHFEELACHEWMYRTRDWNERLAQKMNAGVTERVTERVSLPSFIV